MLLYITVGVPAMVQWHGAGNGKAVDDAFVDRGNQMSRPSTSGESQHADVAINVALQQIVETDDRRFQKESQCKRRRSIVPHEIVHYQLAVCACTRKAASI